MILSLSAFSCLALLATSANGLSAHEAKNHRSLARRMEGHVDIHKRFDASRWTYYDVGLGACGLWNVESDFIVALNAAQFGSGYPGPNCFKTITMHYNGKTTTAKITDMCPGCPYGGLDLSRSLFRFFDVESKGVLSGSWEFGSGSGGGAAAAATTPTTTKAAAQAKPTTTSTTKVNVWTPQAKPTTTWTPEAKPTTTWTPEAKPTTTWTPQAKPTTTSSPEPKPTSTTSRKPRTTTAAPIQLLPDWTPETTSSTTRTRKTSTWVAPTTTKRRIVTTTSSSTEAEETTSPRSTSTTESDSEKTSSSSSSSSSSSATETITSSPTESTSTSTSTDSYTISLSVSGNTTYTYTLYSNTTTLSEMPTLTTANTTATSTSTVEPTVTDVAEMNAANVAAIDTAFDPLVSIAVAKGADVEVVQTVSNFFKTLATYFLIDKET